jgi:hypothetical protein
MAHHSPESRLVDLREMTTYDGDNAYALIQLEIDPGPPLHDADFFYLVDKSER